MGNITGKKECFKEDEGEEKDLRFTEYEFKIEQDIIIYTDKLGKQNNMWFIKIIDV